MKNDLRRTIICLISLLAFVYITSLVFLSEDNIIDSITIIRNKKVISFFKVITRFGDWYTLVLITMQTLIIKEKKYFKYISINLGVSAFLNQLLKMLIKRPRPIDKLVNVGGYSFPSGHAMICTTFYGFLVYLVIKSKLSNKIKVFLSLFLSILVILIIMSRVYLSVHYITDVLSGLTIGIFYLSIYTQIIKEKLKK